MGVSKVKYGDNTLIDLTNDTVTEDTLFDGITAHNKSGDRITGAFTLTEEVTEQNELIAQLKSVLAGKAAGGDGGSVETFTVINNTDSMLCIGGFMCPNYEPIDIPYPNGFLCTFYVIGEPCNASYVDDYGDSWSGQIMIESRGQSAGYLEVNFSAGTTITFEYIE